MRKRTLREAKNLFKGTQEVARLTTNAGLPVPRPELCPWAALSGPGRGRAVELWPCSLERGELRKTKAQRTKT